MFTSKRRNILKADLILNDFSKADSEIVKNIAILEAVKKTGLNKLSAKFLSNYVEQIVNLSENLKHAKIIKTHLN